MKPVRIRRTVKAQVGSFGMVPQADHPDCQVGVPFLADNGRFVITARELDKEGRLHITLKRDLLTRRQRQAAKTRLKKGPKR